MSTIFLDGSLQIEDVLRTSAKNQLDSYADEWIIIFEAIQNALDAVEDSDNPKVKIVFNIEENKIQVYDNGKGFPCDKEYFGLGKGEKFDLKNPSIRGEHGVGIKMVILCSKQFELIARNKKKLWYARFENAFQFLDKKEKEFFDEEYQELERLPDEFNTLVEYTFPTAEDNPIRPILLRNFLISLFSEYKGIKPFDQFFKNRDETSLYVEHYFRTHSYSGDVNRLFDNKTPANIEVTIKKDDSLSEDKKEETYPLYLLKYWQKEKPISFQSKYWDLTELYENPRKMGFLSEDMLNSFVPGKRFGDTRLWVMKISDKNQMKDLITNPLLRDYYGDEYFDLLIKNKIRGIYMVIGSAAKSGKYNINKMLVSKPNQIIAADGVLTTNQIRTPKRGKNQNYLNNIHLVVNIADRVNYGKQGVKNPKLLSNVYAYFEEMYVKTLANLAISVAGKQPKSNSLEEPDIVITDLLNLDTNLSIEKIPFHENTLIALLYELIGKGLITGIKTYHLSSYDQYDGRISVIPPQKEDFKKINRDNDLLNLEFKIKLCDLIDDFETDNKDINDIDLIVLWDDSLPTGSSKYNIVDLDMSSYSGLRIPGIYDVLSSMEGGEAPILNLKQFIDELKGETRD
ncbi:ATP-binding protein [Bacteroidota bacterium]